MVIYDELRNHLNLFLVHLHYLCAPVYPKQQKKDFNYHYCYLSHTLFPPFPNRKSYGPEMFTKCSPHPMCHWSSVTCHLPPVTFQIQFNKVMELVCGGSVINRAYPSTFFFLLFIIKNALITNIYLCWLVVISFWSLKKANL